MAFKKVPVTRKGHGERFFEQPWKVIQEVKTENAISHLPPECPSDILCSFLPFL